MQIVDVYSEIAEYQVKTLPERPYELNTFYNMSKGDQFRDQDKFFSQDFIREYLEEKWRVELHNRDCYLRLLLLREEYKGDIQALREIGKKIVNFAQSIKANENPFLALKINVDKEIVEQKAETADWTE